MRDGPLAVNGGEPTVPPGAVRPWPHVTDTDRAAVMEVLAADNLSEPRWRESEGLARDFAEYVGAQYCIPTNSGTAALHMCIAALGIGPGDEVIVPAFTFWASAAAVLHHNAVPVFVDVDPLTWCLDPDQIEHKISGRTKAIMVVHIHGMPADMEPIWEIADRHGLKVIEDAAQAHGARYRGRACGTLGDVAGFSLQMSKLLTTGSEGGLFVTDDEVYYRRAHVLQHLGEFAPRGGRRQYDAVGLGWMYRGDVFGQAFARSQLRRLRESNARRRANCRHLTDRLAGVDGIKPPVEPSGRDSVFYNYVIEFRPDQLGLDVSPRWLRERAEQALLAEGVFVGQWQTLPVPAQRIFRRRRGYGQGCPWTCHDEDRSPSTVQYREEDYPCAVAFLESHSYIFDIHPPNDSHVMELYIRSIEKVMCRIDELSAPDPGAVDRAMADRSPWEHLAGLTPLGDR
jgi:perosamine synthetase